MSDAAGSHYLIVEGLAKRYDASGGAPSPPVFENVHFRIAKGEFVCIIGHSGCGKTTILNVLAGLDDASAGHVIMDGREVRGPSLDRGVVFQGHALMPWMSVLGNVAFAVKSRHPGWDRRRIAEHPFDGQQHVVQAAQPRQQRVILENDATIWPGPRQLAFLEQHDAAGRCGQAGHQVQQRALAAARVANEGDELAALHFEVDVTQCDEGATLGGENHADVLDLQRPPGVDARSGIDKHGGPQL